MDVKDAQGVPGQQKKRLNPPQMLILIFIVIIIIGAVLLKLPFATTIPITWSEAFFTATSALTITGLTVVDTGQSFTLFGEIVILLLIQIGGLGIMTFAILVFLLLGRKISFKQRLLVQRALNQNEFGGIVRLVKYVLILSFSIEAVAAFLLSLYWGAQMGWGKGIYYSIYYSISAFNNAGFTLWSDSLSRWVGDPVVNIVITTLIIVGGLGFTVIVNLWSARRVAELTLHTKLMLVGTLIINVVAFLVIFFLEFRNPGTLGNLSFGNKMWGAYFQGITTRSTGFNTVDIVSLRNVTLFFMILLMYIGAGSTSTGGGIKLTTFIVLLLSVVKILRGRQEAVAFGRTIKDSIFMKAFALVVMSLTLIFISIFVIGLIEEAPFLHIVFEVVSAATTTGLSTGLSQQLTDVGKWILMLLMFIGRLGPLTFIYSLAAPEINKIRYPEGDLFIG